MVRILSLCAAVLATAQFSRGEGPIREKFTLPGYSQGGVVVDGAAYFTADDAVPDGFPCVGSFDARTGRKIREYAFENTFDSSPLVMRRNDGRWLVLAHECKKAWTKAMFRDDGTEAWTSPANQPGNWFFGYTYYVAGGNSTLVLTESENGLHANSLEDGSEKWWVERSGGMTPAVDQERGLVYYQSNGRLDRIEAATGRVQKSVAVDSPSICQSANTILVKDGSGYFIATYWFGEDYYASSIRVYDKNLDLVWEKKGLPLWQKYVPTYHGGQLFIAGQGTGNGFLYYTPYADDRWKFVMALDIRTGREIWRRDLREFNYAMMANMIYADGLLVAETQGESKGQTYQVFVFDAGKGRLLSVFDSRRYATSCAQPLLCNGLLFSGDLISDKIFVMQVGVGVNRDWPGPFGDPQLNHMAVSEDRGYFHQYWKRPRTDGGRWVLLSRNGRIFLSEAPLEGQAKSVTRISDPMGRFLPAQ